MQSRLASICNSQNHQTCCTFQIKRKSQASGRKCSISCELLSRDCYRWRANQASNVRKKYNAVFKAKVIHLVQPDVSLDQITQKYRISQSLISKWLKDKYSIIAAAADKHGKLYVKHRKPTKYMELYRLLFNQLKAACDKGQKWTSTGYGVKPIQFKEISLVVIKQLFVKM